MDWETSSAGPSRSRGTSFMDRLTGTPGPAPTSEFGDVFETGYGGAAGRLADDAVEDEHGES